MIYVVLLAGLRVSGKREIGQFTLFDLVLILLVSNAVQPAMTGPDNSLLGGLILVATFLVANAAVSELRLRSSLFRRVVEPKSTVIGRDGKWFEDELRRQGVTDEELMTALREHGVASIQETELVVFEGDGSISVIPKEGPGHRRRRRVRFLKR